MAWLTAAGWCLGLALPAFTAEGEAPYTARPLLWETPPAETRVLKPASPGFAPFEFEQRKVEQKLLKTLEIVETQELSSALEYLKKAKEPELILVRGQLHLSAGDLRAARRDFETILASDNMTNLRAVALEGYKESLRAKIKNGRKDVYEPLIGILKTEWRNEEALEILDELKKLPLAPEAKKALAKEEPILALRLGQYEKAAELWKNPGGPSEVRWLSTTLLRAGNFKKAAALRKALAESLPAGAARNKEFEAAFAILAKGGLYADAKKLKEETQELKAQNHDWLLGLSAMMAGKYADSENYFNLILKNSALKTRHAAAGYFRARSLELLKRGREAAAQYKSVASGPFSYYMILAQGRLTPRHEALATPMAELLLTGPESSDQSSL